MITGKIDVMKIRKDKLYAGAKGKYLDITLIPTPTSEYGDDYMIVQDLGKEARQSGEKGPILGNARIRKPTGGQDQPPAQADGQKAALPF